MFLRPNSITADCKRSIRATQKNRNKFEYLFSIIFETYLRTVPTIVITHTFCASRDTLISYGWCLLIQGYFCGFKAMRQKQTSASTLGIQKPRKNTFELGTVLKMVKEQEKKSNMDTTVSILLTKMPQNASFRELFCKLLCRLALAKKARFRLAHCILY